MTMYFLHDNQSGKIATESKVWRGGGKVNAHIPQHCRHIMKMWCSEWEWEAMVSAAAPIMLYCADGCPYLRASSFDTHHIQDPKTWVIWMQEDLFWRDMT